MTQFENYKSAFGELHRLIKSKPHNGPIHIFYEVNEMETFLEQIQPSFFLDKDHIRKKATDGIENRGYVFFFYN